jgi:hypothetical protein
MSEKDEATVREDADAHVGDCPTCGKYRKQIDAGLMAPCFAWRKLKDKEEEGEDE